MIIRAFQLPPGQGDRVAGMPDWATRERFDIRAVMPEGATEQDVPEMLKTLLAERFGLRAHIEQRPYPVFELIVGPAGPKFSEVEAVDERQKDFNGDPGKTASDTITSSGDFRTITRFEPDGLRFITVTGKTRYSYTVVEGNARQLDAERITMQEFKDLLSVERPVVDKTGLTGKYDFVLEWTPDVGADARAQGFGDGITSPAPAPGGPTIFTALQEQLGLRLESQKAPVQIIMIDRAEKPSEN